MGGRGVCDGSSASSCSALRVRGRSRFDSVVLVLLVVVIGSLLWQVFVADVDRVALLRSVLPTPLDPSAALLAVGIVGATVMPHALHFHSAASRGLDDGVRAGSAGRAVARRPADRPQRRHRHDGGRARRTSASSCSRRACRVKAGREHRVGVCRPGGQHRSVAATMLAVALLASGLASTLVGVQTGDVVMAGLRPPTDRAAAPTPARRRAGARHPRVRRRPDERPRLEPGRAVVRPAGHAHPAAALHPGPPAHGWLVNHRLTTAVAAPITAVIVGLCGYLVVSGV